RLANFDLLWQTLDEKYTYFTYKNIDWQALRNKYRPLAAAAKDEEALFQVMGDLLYELKDGHVNLYSYFDISRNWEWYLPYPPNFDFNVLERNYLGDDYQIAGAFRTKIIRNTGYIYYGSFQSPVTSLTIRELLQKYKQANVKGIIIDIRDNGGGSLGTADLIIQHFLSQKTLIGYTRYKNGPAHDDFTEYFPTELEPTSETFTGKVVLLTNRSVFSAANYFAAALSQLPNVTIIGDQTGGGGGAPITAELQIGWRVRYSGTQLFNADKEHLEPGVVPDIKLDISQADQINGKDTILERALDLLNQ
ncbi:MAG: peptidase S41, partial [Verrucomicrobia bacterium]|nr:peptidase S41 [Cytophagales bacterium]